MKTKTKSAMPKSSAKTAYALLSAVKKAILDEPKRYTQKLYILHASDPDDCLMAVRGMPPCGTVGCVAGWVTTLRGVKAPYERVSQAAARILGLDGSQAGRLFLADAVTGTPQTAAHAKNGAAHIERFQKEYAAQLKAKKL